MAIVVVGMALQRNLFAVVVLAGIYSFLMASVLVALDAVDVAMTEASVGAGISTVLLLGALHLTRRRGGEAAAPAWLPLLRRGGRRRGARLRHARSAGVLRSAGADPRARRAALPQRSRSRRPACPNVVTAVLASYRGYDTLGETTVVFTAGVGVIALLRRTRRERRAEREEQP